MLRRLVSLFSRYSAAHLDVTLPGTPITNHDGETVGYVDSVRLKGGRLTVQGWAQASRLRLVLASSEDAAAPTLRREDVAAHLGLPATLGFELSLPATLETLSTSDAPGLVVTPLPGSSPIGPLTLPTSLPKTHLRKIRRQFIIDLGLSMPNIVSWYITKNIRHRSLIKERLGLALNQTSGKIDENLLPGKEFNSTDIPLPEKVDIVLPVYNAYDLLKICLDRVDLNTDVCWRLIIVEDCSSDKRIRPFLRDWSNDRSQVVLLENKSNLGFIGAVNRGLKYALSDKCSSAPVVLLNSDALVPEKWASRLLSPLSDSEVASVTPMSNDAEIFSVPNICVRAVLHPGQAEEIDKVAARIPLLDNNIVTPTGVGFCMAMGRSWLEKIPSLDPIFGRGYGEEVDWCQKAAMKGGRHVALPSLFVEHRGGESFGSAEKLALVAKNNAVVANRYPNYDQNVQDFISADPLRSSRLALGLAWAGSLIPKRSIPVYLAHAMGGGANHWLEHRISEDLNRGYPSVIVRVGTAHRWQVELITPEGRTSGHTDSRVDVVRLLNVLPHRKVVYSCGVGDSDPVEIPDFLCEITSPNDSAEILFHDYFPLSPSYTLLDSDGVYRGHVTPPRDDHAHSVRRMSGSKVSLEAWQDAWAEFAKRADIIVFSEDSAEQVTAVWPHLKDRISLHPHEMRHTIPSLPVPPSDAPPVLAILGNIGRQKGAQVVQDLAKARSRDGQGPRLVLIGNIDPAFSLPETISVHGSYRVDDLENLAKQYAITHWLIPSVWPETFCYTVHEALNTGLPVLAFGLGAQGAAVRRAHNGVEIPFDSQADLVETIRSHMAPAKQNSMLEEAT